MASARSQRSSVMMGDMGETGVMGKIESTPMMGGTGMVPEAAPPPPAVDEARHHLMGALPANRFQPPVIPKKVTKTMGAAIPTKSTP